MRTQKCGGCGSVLDVAQLQKGSKFACSACGTVLTVGEAAVAKRSLKDAGPAFKPKAPQEKEAPATSRRSRRSSGDAPDAGRAPRSRAPLLVAGGAIVLAIVVALALSSGKGGGGGGTMAGGGGGGGAARAPEPVKLSPEAWWLQATTNPDRSPKSLDVAAIETILAEAQRSGFTVDQGFWKPKADKLYGDLLKLKPAHREANEFFGRKSLRDYPDFAEVWRSMEESFRELPRERRELLTAYEERVQKGDPLWMSPEEYEAEKVRFDDFVAWKKKCDADPTFKEIQAGIVRVLETDPVLSHYGATYIDAHPFILFVGSRELFPKPVQGETAEEAKARIAKKTEELQPRLQRLRKLYRAYVANFEERYRKPLGLPEFKPSDLLFQWVFEDREGFDRYNRDATGHEIAGGVLGYFSPKNRWVFLYEREDAEAEGISNDNVMAHESTHQIQWFFSKDPEKRGVNYSEEFESAWFGEGWAEYVGGSCRVHPETGEIQFSWYALGRADWLRFMKKNGIPLIPIRYLAERGNYSEFNQWIANFWLEEARSKASEAAEKFLNQPVYFSSLYAQSWYLVYFLNEYENGKYRKPFLDFILTAMRGRRKPPAFRADPNVAERWESVYHAFEEIFALKTQEDWARLQREHDQFLEKVLQDAPVPKKREGEKTGEGEGDE